MNDIPRDLILDMAGSLRILQSVQGLFVGRIELTNAGKHHSLCIATKGVLQEARQFAVSVADIVGVVAEMIRRMLLP